MIFGNKNKKTTVHIEIYTDNEEAQAPCQEWLSRKFNDSYAHYAYQKGELDYVIRNFRSYADITHQPKDIGHGWKSEIRFTFEYDVASDFAYRHFETHIARLDLFEEYNSTCEDESMMAKFHRGVMY